MRKIIVSAGHTNVPGLDRGASGNGFIEGELTVELRDLIIKELKLLGANYLTDDNRNALAQTLAWLRGKYSNKDILVDLHWNSGQPQANGSEVFIPDNPSQFEAFLGNALLQGICSFGFKSRGVRPESESARKRLGWMRPNAENILIELCFLSNALDMKLYQANKLNIAKKIANTLYQFSKQ